MLSFASFKHDHLTQRNTVYHILLHTVHQVFPRLDAPQDAVTDAPTTALQLAEATGDSGLVALRGNREVKRKDHRDRLPAGNSKRSGNPNTS